MGVWGACPLRNLFTPSSLGRGVQERLAFLALRGAVITDIKRKNVSYFFMYSYIIIFFHKMSGIFPPSTNTYIFLTNIQTYRPSDEAGPSGAFAPKKGLENFEHNYMQINFIHS